MSKRHHVPQIEKMSPKNRKNAQNAAKIQVLEKNWIPPTELIQIKFRGRNSIIKIPRMTRKFNFWKKWKYFLKFQPRNLYKLSSADGTQS